MKKELLEDLLANPSFVRWVRHEASAGERRHWEIWLQEDSGRKQIVEDAKAVLGVFRQEEMDLPDTQIEWLKLENALDKEMYQSKVFQLKSNRRHFTLRKRFLAAAILVIGVCLSSFIVYQSWINQHLKDSVADITYNQEYRTDYGEKVTFRLSDNSRIVLNANSYIRFSTDKDGRFDTKDVWLEGEAYFDITNHSEKNERTFTVYTPDGTVSVLGTRFAVKTFEGESRAVLEEGEILVELPAENTGTVSNDEEGVTLKPGDMAMFSAGHEFITVSQVNPWVYTSWNEDIWVFDDTSISDIVVRIKDTFGIEVKINQEYKERMITGSVNIADIEVLKEALSAILRTSVLYQNQTLYIGNSD